MWSARINFVCGDAECGCRGEPSTENAFAEALVARRGDCEDAILDSARMVKSVVRNVRV